MRSPRYRMGMLTFVTCVAVIYGFVPHVVGAQSELALISLPASVTVDNRVFTEAVGSIPITITHRGDATPWFVTVSRGNAPTFDPRHMEYRFFFGIFVSRLDYNIFTPSESVARDLSGPIAPSHVIAGSFPAVSGQQSQRESFTVRIPRDQFVRDGLYRDEVDITLYAGEVTDPAGARRIQRRTVRLRSVTPSVAQIGLVRVGGDAGGGQRSYTMDFGELVDGARRSADLVYRTNAGFRVDVSSANRGNLVNVNRGGDGRIAYTFRVDGRAYDLHRSRLIALSLFGGTGLSFERRRLDVEIGRVAGAPSGLYEDVITFTISAF